jgi:hypothetical protein
MATMKEWLERDEALHPNENSLDNCRLRLYYYVKKAKLLKAQNKYYECRDKLRSFEEESKSIKSDEQKKRLSKKETLERTLDYWEKKMLKHISKSKFINYNDELIVQDETEDNVLSDEDDETYAEFQSFSRNIRKRKIEEQWIRVPNKKQRLEKTMVGMASVAHVAVKNNNNDNNDDDDDDDDLNDRVAIHPDVRASSDHHLSSCTPKKNKN